MRRTIAALAIVTLAIVSGCGDGEPGEASAEQAASAGPASPSPSPSPAATAAVDLRDVLCVHVSEVEQRLASLRSVELSLPNRVALDIELDKLDAAYEELDDLDLGEREDELARSLTRLGYRLGELELAVEDFRTNTRPRRAAPHVEEDAQKVADELAAFVILSRCS